MASGYVMDSDKMVSGQRRASHGWDAFPTSQSRRFATAAEVMEPAGLNFTVKKVPMFYDSTAKDLASVYSAMQHASGDMAKELKAQYDAIASGRSKVADLPTVPICLP